MTLHLPVGTSKTNTCR